LTDTWRMLVSSEEVLGELPVIGLIRLDRGNAPSPPALDPAFLGKETNSYLYRVKPVTVAGLDLPTVRSAKPLSAAQAAALDAALAELEKAKAISIVSDSGLMVHYQMATAAKTKVPVLLSPLLQAPLLACILKDHESILVITADSRQFSEAELRRCLVGAQLVDERAASRFVLKGCEGLPGFSDSGVIDLKAAQTALSDLVRESALALQKEGNPIGSILLECATLPAFADVLRDKLKLPVFDNLTLSDFAHKALTDNPRFGISFGPQAIMTAVDPATIPAIGILRIDYTYPPALGDAAHPNSYYYRTPHATVKGLSFEDAQKGAPLTPAQRSAMEAGVRELEEKNVMGIAGDCGFLQSYQADARKMSRVPTFISPLLQAPMLARMYAPHEYILVVTANGAALKPQMPKLLGQCTLRDAATQKRFLVVGCEDVPGFGEEIAAGKKIDVERVTPEMLKLVKRELAAMPTIRCILLECTELPPYADAIREATGLPVLDTITLVDFFHGAISENPYFGIDWEKLANTPAFK